MEFIETDSAAHAGRTSEERWIVYLDGQIDDTAAEHLRDEIARREIRSASVFLNSPGGGLRDGMELGRLIRQHGFSTHIGKRNDHAPKPLPGVCYSACVSTFIGGY